jgi:hypothetical protein
MLLWWPSASMERERRLCDGGLALLRRWAKAPDRVGAGLDWLLPVLPLATAAYEERRLYLVQACCRTDRGGDDVCYRGSRRTTKGIGDKREMLRDCVLVSYQD